MCVAPFLLFSWAAQFLPSGLSSIFYATTPIATMLLALAVLRRLTVIKTLALLVASRWHRASQIGAAAIIMLLLAPFIARDGVALTTSAALSLLILGQVSGPAPEDHSGSKA